MKDDEKLSTYASVLSYFILDNVCSSIALLSKQFFTSGLCREDCFTMAREFLFYNMNFCGRSVISWHGEELGERINDLAFYQVGTIIDKNKEELLAKKLDSLTMQTLSDYLAMLRNGFDSDVLRDLYNERDEEYYKYDLLKEPSKGGTAGTLSWEFADKLSQLMNRKDDAAFIMCIYMIVLELNQNFLEARKKFRASLDMQGLE